MEVAIFDDKTEIKEGRNLTWKSVEEIKEFFEENKICGKIAFRFMGADEERGYVVWKIGKNLAQLLKIETEDEMILDFSMAFIRENFPRKIIFSDLSNLDEPLIRNGFYISVIEKYRIFPIVDLQTDVISNRVEEDLELREISEEVFKIMGIAAENEKKFGRSILQEQFEPYIWRHCSEEPLFWGLRMVLTQLFIQQPNYQITFEDSALPVEAPEEDTKKWFSTILSSIKCRLNAIINSQIFAETPQLFRQLFAATCHEIAKLLSQEQNYLSALEILDEGIMKGIQFDDNNLGKMALWIASQLPSLPKLQICESYYSGQPTTPANFREIKVLIRPSLEEFLQHLERPIIIKDFVKHFPIYDFFDFEYLNNVHGYRRVPIEFGSSYAGEDYSQKVVTIHEYLSQFLTSPDSPKAYLAQHALLDQLNLLDSVPIPDYASLLPSDQDALVNVFIGPSGTISPLHFDPRPNFFCQIRGKKFVRLVNPSFKDDLYLNSDPMYANSSVADLEKLDYTKFPNLSKIEIEDVIMEEGDCLFMPAKYFHLMRSLSPSISVSIWI